MIHESPPRRRRHLLQRNELEHRCWRPSHFISGWKMIRLGEGNWSIEVRDIHWWERLRYWKWDRLTSVKREADDAD